MTPSSRKEAEPAKRKPVPTHAAGPPQRLSYALPIEAVTGQTASSLTARFDGARIEHLFAFDAVSPDPNRLDVKVELAPETPPGRYEGTATVGDTTIPIVAEVTARPRARANPSRVRLEVAPAGSATVDIDVFNAGNVPLDLTGSSSFNLLGERSVDDALFAAIGRDVPPEKQRIDVLLDELADSQGGEVGVEADCDTAAIEPGENATLHLALQFSDQIQPGHRYTGSWKPDGLRLRFTITGTEPASTDSAETV